MEHQDRNRNVTAGFPSQTVSNFYVLTPVTGATVSGMTRGTARRPFLYLLPSQVRTMMCDYVKDVGRALVTDPERTKDPIEYVQALLDMRDKYERIITQVRHRTGTVRHSKQACREHGCGMPLTPVPICK